MRIVVKLFAGHKTAIGTGMLEMHVDADATVKDALDTLLDMYPELSDLRDYTMAALNHKHVTMDAKLDEDDELAFFPPIGGG